MPSLRPQARFGGQLPCSGGSWAGDLTKPFHTLNKDIAKLADLLGHASIETTRIYIMETGAANARLLERMHLLL